ncbi:3-phosphoshikimate 1-carboxyvinyltransferase [Paenibacillus sp. 1011MAR3C5]|uniref:3-phosphoshikimate 1-carboxyvinyltransferase n=1 Tax=Paenibacillus sp. 1011MAR3C5 TaxID=1675787 RepID=UPI000E6D0E82|nr:3-phosphoshikimate 1-carboxyvinyltransferase [Paenibacillus sp. 1011MAR3C5]RJE90347.1 3-phosphoshikimate 1-carboxyvinyltransferase [Paenibacillus sp. 1011MAR3C5]
MVKRMSAPDLEARSPWSAHPGIRQVKISPPQQKVAGAIRVSGSKSLTNRALILAAMAEGTSRIDGILRSDDAYWCIESLRKLGVAVSVKGESAIVTGCGGDWPVKDGELYVGAAGTVARFLPGALAAGHGSWTLKGSKRMEERPSTPLLMALINQGAKISYLNHDHAYPFVLEASGLDGGIVEIAGDQSSQFVSGLLLAAPYARQPIILKLQGSTVQKEYVNMTIELMRAFGIQAEEEGSSYRIPIGTYAAGSLSLEPDISTSCYFWAAAALTGGRIRTEGIDAARTRQPDIEMLDVLERMGCAVTRGDGYVEVEGAAQLRGGLEISMERWSDQTLTLAVLALFADAPITLKDAAHIRHHECDRISAICTELRRLQVDVEEHADGLTVYPGAPVPVVLDSHDDHRMAMALSLIGLRADGITILDPGCVSKTCPDYFERLRGLGVGVDLSE